MNKGTAFALFAGILSGFTIFYNKVIVVSGIDPLVLNIFKNAGAALVLTLLMLPHLKELRSLTWKDTVRLIGIALIGGSIPFILFFDGLRTVPALSANIIQKSMFVWVGLLAIPFLKEKMSKIALVGYGVLILALLLPSLSEIKLNNTTGLLMICTATLLWSIEYILVKKTIKTIHPSITAWARMAGGVVVLVAFGLFKFGGDIPAVPEKFILPIVGSGILLATYVTFIHKALAKIPATTTASIITIAPVVTFALQAMLLSDPMTQKTTTMIVLTIIGVLIFLTHTTNKNLTSSI